MSRRGAKTSEFALHILSIVAIVVAAAVAGLNHLTAKQVAAGGVPLAGSLAWINAAYTRGRSLVKAAEANAQALLGKAGVPESLTDEVERLLATHLPAALKPLADQIEAVGKQLAALNSQSTQTFTLVPTPSASPSVIQVPPPGA